MRRFAYGAVCLALWAAACGSDDEKRAEPAAEAGAAGADTTAGGSSSSGGDGSGEAGEAAAGGQPLGSAGEGAAGGSGGSAGSGGTPPGTPVSVAGRLVDRAGRPVAGVSVEVNGEPVTTDADGGFAASTVAPYDLVLRYSETETEVYLGVTRADPRIVGNYETSDRSTTLEGKLSGAGYPVPTGHETYLSLFGVDVGFRNVQAAGSTGEYVSSGSPAWGGADTTQATLFALQRNIASGAFTAIGSKVVTLTHEEDLVSPDADLTLVAASLRDLDVNIDAPAGIAYSSIGLFVGGAPVSVPSLSSAFTVQVPEDVPEQVGFALNLSGTVQGRRVFAIAKLSSSLETLDVDLGVPPSATSPADETVLSAATGAFRFTPQPGAVSRVLFTYTEFQQGGELRLDHTTTVTTDGTSIALSRLLALDLDLPEGEGIGWTVMSRADAPTVDAFLAPAHDPLAEQRGGADAERLFWFQD